VLVHGAFSDHRTNWEFVLPLLENQFTLYAMARRGRGRSDATQGHSVSDEAADAAALIRAVGEPVSLLGHSYGAHVALAAAALAPGKVRRLVLYEPPWPHLVGSLLKSLAPLWKAGDWDAFTFSFFRDFLLVPVPELECLRAEGLWAPMVADAKATLGDLRALSRYHFHPERFRSLRMPVLLQYGTESPRHLYATDVLADILPNATVGELEGQAHEAMTTAPKLYAEAVAGFLLESSRRPLALAAL
jgi:pimeloyl-ACP methyl ester carboxylesterase